MTPIIDVHGHIFNARDIPLKGYLLSRKYNGIQQILSGILIPAAAKRIRRKLEPWRRQGFWGAVWSGIALMIVYICTGKQYRLWGDTLSKNLNAITCEMLDTFRKDGIELYVPLMIDYEYWFENTPDHLIKKQIELIFEQIVVPYGGWIHPFVAFDPARELAFRHKRCTPDGFLEKHGSLALVKDAIENKGFIGVKLYNAMGYRPWNNHLVEDERRKIALHDVRYDFKGEEYDRVLGELYDYCVENGVPVTTHCGMGGSESYPDASFDFGKAVYWREVLDQEKYKNLHLNLAHFGWNKDQGYEGNESWVTEICGMMNDYDFLFADVSHHRVVLKKYRKQFLTGYPVICENYPNVKHRLLFGIDWHVIKRIKHYTKFKDSYIEVLRHDNLFSQTDIADFLGGNAVVFLGLEPGGQNRNRLEQFYQTHDIKPPQWFESTGD